MSWTSWTQPRPLTRLMNSMFHGVQGASARTPFMYRSIASRVAGSSQDSGSRTVRDGTRSSCTGGSSSSTRRSRGSSERAPSLRPRIGVHLQRPDARGEVDDAVEALSLQGFLQRVHPHPQAQVKFLVAVLDDDVVVAVAPVDHGGHAGARLAPGEDAVVAVAAGAQQRRDRAAAAQRGGVGFPHRHEADRVARAQLARLPQLAAGDDGGADEPAEARPVRDRG